MKKRIEAFRCPTCSSTNVVIRTDAKWDFHEQKWVESCQWNAYCLNCGWAGDEAELWKEYEQ